MSNVSDNHDVLLYTPKSKALSDQRLSVIGFKTPAAKSDKDSPDYDPAYKRPEARCVSVPKLEFSITPQILKDAMQVALEDLQDALIRKIVVAAIEEGKNVITIMGAQINFEALQVFAAEEATNGKLNKDAIADWFDTDLADQLTLALADAMKLGEKPTADQERKLADAVTSYKKVFSTLAAPKAGLSPKIALQLQRVLAVAENKENRVFKGLEAKIKANLEQKDPELVGL